MSTFVLQRYELPAIAPVDRAILKPFQHQDPRARPSLPLVPLPKAAALRFSKLAPSLKRQRVAEYLQQQAAEKVATKKNEAKVMGPSSSSSKGQAKPKLVQVQSAKMKASKRAEKYAVT
jgi:hypothetical protein